MIGARLEDWNVRKAAESMALAWRMDRWAWIKAGLKQCGAYKLYVKVKEPTPD